MKSRVIRLLLVLAIAFNLASARIQSSALAKNGCNLPILNPGQEGKKPPEQGGAGRDRENPPEKSPAEPPKGDEDKGDDKEDRDKKGPSIKPPMKQEPPVRASARARLSLHS